MQRLCCDGCQQRRVRPALTAPVRHTEIGGGAGGGGPPLRATPCAGAAAAAAGAAGAAEGFVGDATAGRMNESVGAVDAISLDSCEHRRRPSAQPHAFSYIQDRQGDTKQQTHRRQRTKRLERPPMRRDDAAAFFFRVGARSSRLAFSSSFVSREY